MSHDIVPGDNDNTNTSDNRNIQLISDIHLDIRDESYEVVPTCPTLIVAGDVCPFQNPKYRDWMGTLFKNHRYGAYVPGNHDIWGASEPIEHVLDAIERVCKSLDSSPTLLRSGNLGLDIPDTNVRIVGATLWTRIPSELTDIAPFILNDFKFIRTGINKVINVGDVNRMHETDKNWIRTAVDEAEYDGRGAVVVTHHAPSTSLSVLNKTKSQDGMGVFYYGTDMERIIRMPNIRAWLYGHTHESRVMRLRDIDYPFVTNALGYPREKTGFALGAGIRVY